MAKKRKPKHGTYARAQVHRKEGERACGPCLAAAAEYTKQWRAGKGKVKSHIIQTATNRALADLKTAHPEEFRRLYQERRAELLAAGGVER